MRLRSLFAVAALVVSTFSDTAKADLFFFDGPQLAFFRLALADSPHRFQVIDMDGDGRDDLVRFIPDDSGTNLVVYSSDGTGALAAGTVYSFPAYNLAIVGERNPDGSRDLMACSDFEAIRAMSIGTPAFPTTTFSLPAGTFCAAPPLTADVNGDGYADLVFKQTGGQVFSMLRIPAGGFASPVSVPSLAGGREAVADFTGDGAAEVASYTATQILVSVLDGGGTWVPAAVQPLTQCSILQTGDFDGDGADDLICLETALRILRRDSGGAFQLITTATLPNPTSSQFVGTGDFDGDGHTDVVARSRIVLNDGSDQLGQQVNHGTEAYAAGELDGNERTDLVLYRDDWEGGNHFHLFLRASLSRGWQPTIVASPASLSTTQGSTGAQTAVAIVSDVEDSAGSLQVSLVSAPSAITLSNFANAGGAVTATLTTGCSAASGSIVLAVTDSDGATNTTTLPITVGANVPPQPGVYPSATGANTTVTPDQAPFDPNGSLAAATATGPPGFPATMSVDLDTGEVQITGAPPGTHTITVSVTDNCGASAATTFQLHVDADVPAASTVVLILLAVALLGFAWMRLS